MKERENENSLLLLSSTLVANNRDLPENQTKLPGNMTETFQLSETWEIHIAIASARSLAFC